MKACIISAKAARGFMQNIFLPQEIFGKAYKKRCWLFASKTYISSVFPSLYLEKLQYTQVQSFLLVVVFCFGFLYFLVEVKMGVFA